MAPASPAASKSKKSSYHQTDVRIAPVHIMPKPVHPSPPLAIRDHKKPRLDSPPTSPSRRRAPALERLPRWLFTPVRHFVSARSELPLPKRVAVGGKPFYDWDAWALSLLRPSLWRRRGPWQRLVAGCTAWKPSVVDSLDNVKSALVRIVVADVVSLLVNRSGDQLTPEDRNWITSVASRQRGRDQRKPTLMLLFDLAFPLFDLALYCRCHQRSTDAHVLAHFPGLDGEVEQEVVRIAMESVDSTSTIVDDTESERGSKHEDKGTSLESRKDKDILNMDPFIFKMMQLINPMGRVSSDASTIGTVRLVVNTIEALLQRANAPRWYKSYSSPSKLRTQSLKRIAITFVERVPLHDIPVDNEGKHREFTRWMKMAFLPEHWRYWAELANDFTYMNLSPSDRDHQARLDLCDLIVKYLLRSDKLSGFEEEIDDDENQEEERGSGETAEAYIIPDEHKFPLRKLLDIAINLEQFFALFVETHGNEKSTASDVAWLVGLFERIIQDLSTIRDLLILGSSREKAMAGWSSLSLDVSSYYRDAMSGSQQMREDIDKALQSAFSEASWSPQTRTMRFMVQQPCFYPSNRATENSRPPEPAYQFWVATLDLRDPMYQAVAIVPWDPHRALKLLDDAIGLTSEVMREIMGGKQGLPLWDYRRVAICRLVLQRGNFSQAVLILERLQRLFDQKDLHEGGNFSKATPSLLEAGAREGNICAQTTHGLLLAGEGAYWDVARCWSGCEKSTQRGVQKLYSSAMAGDLEASTALSHIWAERGSKDWDVFEGVALEQIFALFKIAVTSQNAQAVMNMGVMWRYGVSCLQPDPVIAVDAFLMALQGALLVEARSLAATHLLETLGDKQCEVSETLALLIAGGRSDCSSTSSLSRIDNFGGPPERKHDS